MKHHISVCDHRQEEVQTFQPNPNNFQQTSNNHNSVNNVLLQTARGRVFNVNNPERDAFVRLIFDTGSQCSYEDSVLDEFDVVQFKVKNKLNGNLNKIKIFIWLFIQMWRCGVVCGRFNRYGLLLLIYVWKVREGGERSGGFGVDSRMGCRKVFFEHKWEL